MASAIAEGKGRFWKVGDKVEVAATGDFAEGDVLEVGEGLAGIAVNSGVSGDTIVVQVEGIIKVAANNSTGSVGDLVGWVNAGEKGGAGAGDGAANVDDDPSNWDFALGRLVGKDKGSGDDEILVKLGRQFASHEEVADLIAAI